MYCTSKKVDDAIDWAIALEGLHNEFMQELVKPPSVDPYLGKFSVKDGGISATCLGVELHVPHKSVIQNQWPAAIEYSFVADHNGEYFIVSNMYLKLEGFALYPNLWTVKPICKLRNLYLVDHVLRWLADEVLKSTISPSKSRSSTDSLLSLTP